MREGLYCGADDAGRVDKAVGEGFGGQGDGFETNLMQSENPGGGLIGRWRNLLTSKVDNIRGVAMRRHRLAVYRRQTSHNKRGEENSQ